MSIPYIPYVDVKALETYIATVHTYMKTTESPDIPETEEYLGVLRLPQYTASETCLDPEQISVDTSKMRGVLLLLNELYEEVEARRQCLINKRLQQEKDIEKTKALLRTVEQANVRLMSNNAELEKLGDRN